jgi:hypothetical protein
MRTNSGEWLPLLGLTAILLLGTNGCTGIGYMGGLAYDTSTADETSTVSFGELDAGDHIQVVRKNGVVQHGHVVKNKENNKLEFVFVSGSYRMSEDLEASIDAGEVTGIAKIEKKSKGRVFGSAIGFITDVTIVLYLLTFNTSGGGS